MPRRTRRRRPRRRWRRRTATPGCADDEPGLRAAGRLLSRRDHAGAELAAKLARGLGPEAASALVAELAERGLVDDGRFAAMLANRHLERGLGPLRIRADLERAGVDRELVAAILSALEPGAVEAAARTALGSRTGAAGAGRLARRGFDEDLIERLGLRPDI